MNEVTQIALGVGEMPRTVDGEARPRAKRRIALLVSLGAVGLAVIGGGLVWDGRSAPASQAMPPPPPQVTVSLPLQQTVQTTARFLGQFSAVDSVELRAQVGGTLTEIDFRDGQIVHKGDLLFVIDPRPFQIKLDQAVAQLQTGAGEGDAEPGRAVAGAATQADRASARPRPLTSAPPTMRTDAGRHRHRQGGDQGRPARPGILACHRPVHRAHRRASRLGRQTW